MQLSCRLRELLLLFLFSVAATNAQQPPLIDVAVYMDRGVWEAGAIAFEHVLDWKRLTHERIDARVLNSTVLQDRYRALCIPGGYAYDYKLSISAAGERQIRDFVDSGGAYIGICAGAYYASADVYWEGASYPYSLSLFRGQAFGPLENISPWPDYALTTISLNQRNAVTARQQSSFTTLYFGGPAFHPDTDMVVDTLATWNEHHNYPAIISFERGNGRVLLIGPHLEIEENSSRDGGDFADELDDPETEWGLLWALLDWALGATVTDTAAHTTIIPSDPTVVAHRLHSFLLYPDPANDVVTVGVRQRSRGVIEFRDLLGRCMLRKDIDTAETMRLDISGLHAGTWIVIFRTDVGAFTSLIRIVK